MARVVPAQTFRQLVEVVDGGGRQCAARDVAQHVDEIHEVPGALLGQDVHERGVWDAPFGDPALHALAVRFDELGDVALDVGEIPRVVVAQVDVDGRIGI
jgi:hypothetical protein